MASIHEALAPIARRQLSGGPGQPLEIESPDKMEAQSRERGMDHDQRLYQLELGQRASARDRVGVVDRGYRLRPGVGSETLGAHGHGQNQRAEDQEARQAGRNVSNARK
jgi:hypothetical protein